MPSERVSDGILCLKGQVMSDFLPEFEPFAEKIAATAKPVVRFSLKKETVELWDSKVGGRPYLPEGMEYPQNAQGQPLSLLAQINFAQMPHLPDYPTEGIVQFFVDGYDDLSGMDFDDLRAQKGFRVLYHREVRQEGLRSDVPAYSDFGDFGVGLPFGAEEEFRMVFSEQETQYLSFDDYRFDQTFPEMRKLILERVTDTGNNDWRLYENYREASNQAGHCIGGYPCFAQYDPRGGSLEGYELLFQLESQYDENEGIDIMWGDMGVGNFFIAPEDLEKCDFSKTAFTWDCG